MLLGKAKIAKKFVAPVDGTKPLPIFLYGVRGGPAFFVAPISTANPRERSLAVLTREVVGSTAVFTQAANFAHREQLHPEMRPKPSNCI